LASIHLTHNSVVSWNDINKLSWNERNECIQTIHHQLHANWFGWSQDKHQITHVSVNSLTLHLFSTLLNSHKLSPILQAENNPRIVSQVSWIKTYENKVENKF
jgi:hypothetical protein